MPRPPNVLLIVADDVPRNMLDTYGAAHGLSPAIDSLARGAGGAAFLHAYTPSPLCTPARFSLLTGRYASNASSIGSHRPWNLVGFNTFLTGAVPTLAHRLRAAGYATIFAGKYHLGFPLQPRGAAAADRRAAFGGGGRGLTHADLVSAVEKYAGFETIEALWGGNRQTVAYAHHPEYMAARAAAAMGRAQAASRQWFVYFAPTVPHAPFSLPHSLLANASLTPEGFVTADPKWRESRAALLARYVESPHPTLSPFPPRGGWA